jgi:hypothetical protein
MELQVVALDILSLQQAQGSNALQAAQGCTCKPDRRMSKGALTCVMGPRLMAAGCKELFFNGLGLLRFLGV